jgi:hypothetical protein
MVVSSIPSAPKQAPQAQLAAVTSKPLAAETVAVREPETQAEPEAEPAPDTAGAPESMPLPTPPPVELSGTVEKVIDTGTL